MARIEELHVIKHALPLPGCMLLLEFEDGSLRVADLSGLARKGGDLARLSDPSYFERVRVDEEADTVIWPDDIDLDPDVLYHESVPVPDDLLRELQAQARRQR
jgi:hypothetical protein